MPAPYVVCFDGKPKARHPCVGSPGQELKEIENAKPDF